MQGKNGYYNDAIPELSHHHFLLQWQKPLLEGLPSLPGRDQAGVPVLELPPSPFVSSAAEGKVSIIKRTKSFTVRIELMKPSNIIK